MLTKSKIIAAAAAAVLAFAAVPAAASATIFTPANGATYQISDANPIPFQWSLALDEWGSAWIGFAASPDGPWSPKPQETFVGDAPMPDAVIVPRAIGAGTWWWRPCDHSINIGDLQCQFSADPPQQVTIVAGTPLRITSGPPASTNSTSATFTFDDLNGPSPEFTVSLDGEAQYGGTALPPDPGVGLYGGITTPWGFGVNQSSASFSDLPAGTHTLTVTDQYGSMGSVQPMNPAVTYTWTVTAPLAPPAPPKLPKLTAQAAQHWSAVALKRNFKGLFYLGGFRVTHSQRISRTKIRDSVAWYQGDYLFNGKTTIWYSFDTQGRTAWNYSYDITRVDDYCHSVQHRPLSKCSKHYHVG